MMELCLKHHVLVVSDEIHSDLIFHGKRHIPTASLSPEIAANVVTGISATKTFNLAENKALTLSEVLGKNAADTDSYVKEKFEAYVKEDAGELIDYQENIEKALSAVNFCLTEDALVLYYNPYDILPYAAGSPEVKVPYADTTIKLALSES